MLAFKSWEDDRQHPEKSAKGRQGSCTSGGGDDRATRGVHRSEMPTGDLSMLWKPTFRILEWEWPRTAKLIHKLIMIIRAMDLFPPETRKRIWREAHKYTGKEK